MRLVTFNNPYKYKECSYCNGDGYTETLSCSKPQSDCCGGCYKRHWCDECDGTGKVVDDEYDFYSVKQRYYRKKFDVKYWRLSCRITLDKYQFKINQNKNLLKELWKILKP